MTGLARRCAVFAALAGVIAAGAKAAEVEVDHEPKLSASATGFYYAMHDQPDFGVGVASINRGALHFEGRYNYEVRDAGSLFVGWKFSGGDAVTFEITPIVGGLVGAARGFVPGVEASVAYGSLDAYIEAEYVDDRDHPGNSYYYAWSELGWKPVEWLRLGLVGQRTRVVETGRDLQRGLFAQFFFDKMTLGVYAFNPDSASRYAILSLSVQF
jgi:hypothetical protein